MRKLASIQVIKSLKPIAGADRIVEATVQGWQCIVGIDHFKVGDLCVFFEVDSILPVKPWSEFLASKGRRIKTMKMKGVLSQGLALPLKTVLPDAYQDDDGSFMVQTPLDDEGTIHFSSLIEGDDVTALIGVVKYDNEVHSSQPGVHGINPTKEADFPSFVPKTDEERIQSTMGSLRALQGRQFVSTVKADGSSFTATYDQDGKFHVCSRNFSIKRDEGNFWKVAIKYDLELLLRGTDLALQGELIGPGIQKNRHGLENHDLMIFSGYLWKQGRYLIPSELQKYCDLTGLRMVDTEEQGVFNYELEGLLEKSKGLYPETILHKNQGIRSRREGLVYRSNDDGPRISFKVLNNDFLLKDED